MRNYFLLLFLLISSTLPAQDLTGIWRGYFQSKGFAGMVTEYYKYEVQLSQTGSSVKGVTYSYKDTTFYGKAVMTGVFQKPAQFRLNETKIVEIRMPPGDYGCVMSCDLKYEKSGKEEFLEGTFTSYRLPDSALCGSGTVILRKVAKSDFRPEPFLSRKQATGPPDPRDRAKATTPPKPPAPAAQPATPVKRVPAKPLETDSSGRAQLKKTSPPDLGQPRELPGSGKPLSAPNALRSRENVLIQTIEADAGEIVLKIYDNGIIDYDTVSVYHNNRLVVDRKLLTADPIEYRFRIDENNSEQEIIMVAESLGEVPPNTALMIVEAGTQRFEVRVTSTEEKNAKIRFVYRKPDK